MQYFNTFMSGDALQTCKNINSPTWKNFGETLSVFLKKYVKAQSMATAKHKDQKNVFNIANQKLVEILEEIQRLAEDAFRIAAHTITEQLRYAKMPPHLEKSISQAHLEIGAYERNIPHLEREL